METSRQRLPHEPNLHQCKSFRSPQAVVPKPCVILAAVVMAFNVLLLLLLFLISELNQSKTPLS